MATAYPWSITYPGTTIPIPAIRFQVPLMPSPQEDAEANLAKARELARAATRMVAPGHDLVDYFIAINRLLDYLGAKGGEDAVPE